MSQEWKDVKEVVEFALLAFGVVYGIPKFIVSMKEARRAREDAAYDALDKKYTEFQKLCFDNPHLQIYDGVLSPCDDDALMKKKADQEYYAFSMLFSIFERAYLLRDSISSKQWRGWDDYCRDFMTKKEVQHIWDQERKGYDSEFKQYMEKKKRNEMTHPTPWVFLLLRDLFTIGK